MKTMPQLIVLALLISVFPKAASANPHWYKSKKFWIPVAVNVAAMSADYAASQGAYSRGAVEADPIFGSPRPSFGRMFAIGTPIALGYSFASYKLSVSSHKPMRYASVIPTAYHAGNHVRLAVKAERFDYASSIRLRQPPRF